MSEAVRCKALKSFDSSRYGSYMRVGSIFWSEPDYAQQLVRQNMVEILTDLHEPPRKQAFAAAPRIAGKGLTEDPPLPSPLIPSAVMPDVGPAPPSPVSRAAPRLRKKTVRTSEADAKP